jgi:hypothetical protein
MNEIGRNKLGPFQEERPFVIKVEPKQLAKLLYIALGNNKKIKIDVNIY